MSMDEFLLKISTRLVEKTVFTRNVNTFNVYPSEIPPLIASSVAGQSIYNTEDKKKSVYLPSSVEPRSM